MTLINISISRLVFTTFGVVTALVELEIFTSDVLTLNSILFRPGFQSLLGLYWQLNLCPGYTVNCLPKLVYAK